MSFGFQCPRWNLDPWVYELPDSHFDIKQFAFRVTALAYGFPLEEPLLWCALNPDGYSHSAIRSAPIQESHRLTPFFPDRQQANVCPWRTDDSTAGPPGGWLFSSVSTSRKTRRRVNLRSERFGSLPGQAEVGIPSYSDEQRISSRPQQQHALLFGTAELAY